MDVTLADKEFKALSSDTRRTAIKLLKERNHTLSELAKKQGISSPSMKTHMDMLKDAGIVELRDEGRKWKYYALTGKGSELAMGRESESTVFVVLGAASVMLIAILFMGMLSINTLQPQFASMPIMEKSLDGALGGDMVTAPATTEGGVEVLSEIAEERARAEKVSLGEGNEYSGISLLEIYTYFATAVMLAIIVGYTARIFIEKRKKGK